MEPRLNTDGRKPSRERPAPIGPELPGTPESRLAAEIIAWLHRDALKELGD